MTRPTSRTPRAPPWFRKVAICDTDCAPYFCFTYSITRRAALAEVDVEIRHRHALGIEKRFEQEVVAQRIQIGDAERIGRPAIPRPEPPGPTGTPFDFAQLMKSATIRKLAGETHLD